MRRKNLNEDLKGIQDLIAGKRKEKLICKGACGEILVQELETA